MSKTLPPNPSMEFLRKEAKDLLDARERGDRSVVPVIRHLRRTHDVADETLLGPEFRFSLQEAQNCLAIEYGFHDWSELKARVELSKGGRRRFNDVEEIAGLDNAVLQMLFREIDDWCLAIAAVKGSARLRERLWENMTERHRERLERDPEAQSAGAAKIEEAREQTLFLLNRLHEMGLIERDPAAPRRTYFDDTPGNRADQDRKARERYLGAAGGKPASRRTNAELVPIFRALSDVSRSVGILTLEPIAAEFLDEELLRHGAELAADTIDYDTMRRLMESKRDVLLAQYKRRLDMTVEAMLEIACGSSPRIVEDVCRKFA